MKKTRIYAGLAAILFIAVTMDYVVVLLAPLDYLEISTPRLFLVTPILLGVFGYFLTLWRIITESRRMRVTAYIVRSLLFIMLCTIGLYAPYAYLERNVEFIPVYAVFIETDRTLQIEQALGFKVGFQLSSSGDHIFFKRIPGREEKVKGWLDKMETNTTTNVTH
jgi:hypothetical protein